MVEAMTTGTVFNIQKFSVHDGPGIRTTVFLKGCPLRCKWCSNPESQTFSPSVLFDKNKCIECGLCINACTKGAMSRDKNKKVDTSKCVGCGECANVCPTKALILSGKKMTVAEVIDEVKKDVIHYRRSSGGMTLSGGEPLAQPEFTEALLRSAKANGIHTAIETTGLAAPEVLDRIIPLLDVVLMDIKNLFPEKHIEFTGVENKQILRNAIHISKLAKQVSIRVPVIPGFNDDEQSIKAIATFATHMSNVTRLHLLPYHNYGQGKYNLLNRPYEFTEAKTPSDTVINQFKSIVEAMGVECVIGG
ncbi:glycyl-radical enzyme activating protein [Thaumasiovibrio sp. DFM-14]|uniref:glycyl-radical enzyme activating protein n=1 Tax=Thaumasiovibrio sp. DFM-14 TaxID=3384792 RepID=UPI0039A2787B